MKIHPVNWNVAAGVALAVIATQKWGFIYGAIVLAVLVWLHTLIMIAIGYIEMGKDRRQRALMERRARFDELIEDALVEHGKVNGSD